MNTVAELDAYFERVPEHVLTVVDQAYFEYIDQLRLSRRRRALPEAGAPGRRASHLLEDLRARRAARRLRGRSSGRVRVDGEGAATVRPDDTGPGRCRGQHGRGRRARERRRAVNAEGLARLERSCRSTASIPAPSVGNFLFAETGGDAVELYDRLLREGVIVRPLAGFGAPTAIRVTVGTPDELEFFAAALGRVLQPA